MNIIIVSIMKPFIGSLRTEHIIAISRDKTDLCRVHDKMSLKLIQLENIFSIIKRNDIFTNRLSDWLLVQFNLGSIRP